MIALGITAVMLLAFVAGEGTAMFLMIKYRETGREIYSSVLAASIIGATMLAILAAVNVLAMTIE